MIDQTAAPFTDDDLRAEAARQLATAAEDPDFMGIGEQMEGSKIPSRDDFQWDQLGDADFDTARHGIDDLISGAADCSEWAVALGADGLEPDGHELTWSAGDRPIVRIHFAFHPDMSSEARDALVRAIGGHAEREMQAAAAGQVPADESEGGAL